MAHYKGERVDFFLMKDMVHSEYDDKLKPVVVTY